ncbi:MAG: hypothetical protein P8M28_00045, partial [Alphaproteobacteria bacterium]|nr:hypothetical protein [Alphaproteobacteria bacterium]
GQNPAYRPPGAYFTAHTTAAPPAGSFTSPNTCVPIGRKPALPLEKNISGTYFSHVDARRSWNGIEMEPGNCESYFIGQSTDPYAS